MNDHGNISQVRHSEDLVIRLVKADSDRQVSLAFATMDLMRERMHRFSSAKS